VIRNRFKFRVSCRRKLQEPVALFLWFPFISKGMFQTFDCRERCRSEMRERCNLISSIKLETHVSGHSYHFLHECDAFAELLGSLEDPAKPHHHQVLRRYSGRRLTQFSSLFLLSPDPFKDVDLLSSIPRRAPTIGLFSSLLS